MKRPQTSLFREPVLLIVDSYGPHIALAENNPYEKQNVFIAIVPPKMTGLLQPLDVVCNKSFQDFYNDSYDNYISEAINDPDKQTNQGNPKMPSYQTVSEWVVGFTKNLSRETVVKAFTCCGLIDKSKFNVEKLHTPLKELFNENVDICEWTLKFGNTVLTNTECFFEDCNFFWPENISTSFFECIKQLKSVSTSFEDWIKNYVAEILKFLKLNVSDLVDDGDERILKAGQTTETNIEIYAVSIVESWNLTVISLDRDCCKLDELLFGVDNPLKEVQIIKVENYYGLNR